jgi:hypothetical protein
MSSARIRLSGKPMGEPGANPTGEEIQGPGQSILRYYR